MTLPAYDLDAVRRSFPIAQHLVYLNHASISPVPLATQQVMDAVNAQLVDDPMALFPPTGPLGDIFSIFSVEIARFINAAHPEEIVGVTSTSSGINAVAQAVDWQPGDNVIFSNVEFPSNAYPWMVLERRGVEIRCVSCDEGGLSLEALDAAADDRTRLVAVSAVQFLTGHRANLTALGAYCRTRGILFAVDAIQAAGHIPIDVQAMQIDVLAAGGQKSLMGPPGQGFLYVRDEVAQDMLPGTIGPNAVEGWEHWLHYDLTPRAGALRFMMGTPNMAGMFGLVESIRFLSSLGREHIDAWTRHLGQVARRDLEARGFHVVTPADPAQCGPILTFQIGDASDLKDSDARAARMLVALNTERVRVTKHWDARGLAHLRIATHCYNTEEEVLRVGQILGENQP